MHEATSTKNQASETSSSLSPPILPQTNRNAIKRPPVIRHQPLPVAAVGRVLLASTVYLIRSASWVRYGLSRGESTHWMNRGLATGRPGRS